MKKETTVYDTVKSLAKSSMSQDEYYAMSEDRKVITPENIGGLIKYPALFKAMQDDREMRPALSEAIASGRAMCDYLTLTCAEFSDKYVVAEGPINPRTGKPYGTETKAYADWAATQTKTPILQTQVELFGKMTKAFESHKAIETLTCGMEKFGNVVLTAEICGVQCSCKIDRLYANDKAVVAVDIKTTESLDAFTKTADGYYYLEQQVLIKRILEENGIYDAQVIIGAIEKCKLPRCGVFVVGTEKFTEVSARLYATLADYKSSCESGVFKTRFEDTVTL